MTKTEILMSRCRRYNKLVQLQAPEQVQANERDLIQRALEGLSPAKLARAMGQYAAFCVQRDAEEEEDDQHKS